MPPAIKKRMHESHSDTNFEEMEKSTSGKKFPMDNNPKFPSGKDFLNFFLTATNTTGTKRSSVFKAFVDEVEQYNLGLSKYHIVEEYLKFSGNCSELLQLLGNHEMPLTNAEVIQLFAVFEKILLSIAEELHTFENTGQNIAKSILQSGMRTLNSLLSLRHKSATIKIAFKLLTAMVAQGTISAKDVQMAFDFQREGLSKLLNLRNSKDTQDVRVCFLHFVLSFFIAGDNSIIQKLLEEKGFLNGVFPGLENDTGSVISLFLTTVKEKVLENPGISKTLKIRVLNDSTLPYVFSLFSWKGPKYRIGMKKRKFAKINDIKFHVEEASEVDVEMVRSIAFEFLLVACCSHKFGIIFHDYTLGISGKNLNHVITNVLSSLSQPFANPRLSELIVEILKACPDQVHLFLRSMLLEPRVSVTWFQAMKFVNTITNSQDPMKTIFMVDETKSPKRFSELFKRLICPIFTKMQLENTLRENELEIQYELMSHVLMILEKMRETIDFLGKTSTDRNFSSPDTSDFTTALQETLIKFVPDSKTIFDCLNTIPRNKLPLDKAIEGLPVICVADHIEKSVQLLTTLKQSFPQTFMDFSVPYNVLLEVIEQHSHSLSSSQVERIRLKTLQYFALSEIPFASLLQQGNFEEMPVYLLLDMFLTTSDINIRLEIQNLLKSFLVSTMLFDDPETELGIWMRSLELSKVEYAHDGAWLFCMSLFDLVSSPHRHLDLLGRCFSKAFRRDLVLDDAESQTDDLLMSQEISTTSISQSSVSPLLPAALSILKETTNERRNGAVMYISSVAREILHRQQRPEVVSLLLHHYARILPASLMEYSDVWLPSEQCLSKFSGRNKAICSYDSFSTTLRNIFLSLHTTGSLPSSIPNDAVSHLTPKEIPSLIHQLLLYVQTVLKRARDDDVVDALATFLAVIDTLLQVSKSHKPSDIIETSPFDDLIEIVLTRPILCEWFLRHYETSNDDHGSIKRCVNLVTLFACKYLDVVIDKRSRGGSERTVEPFKTKAIRVFVASFLDRRNGRDWWLEMADLFAMFQPYLKRDESIEVVESLLVAETTTLESVEFACKFLNDRLETLFCSSSVDFEDGGLKPETIRCLAALADKFEKDAETETDLASHLLFHLDRNPLCCFLLNIDCITSLLEHASVPRIKLVTFLAQNSPAHLQALRYWLKLNCSGSALNSWPSPSLALELIAGALVFKDGRVRKSDALLPIVAPIFWQFLRSCLIGEHRREKLWEGNDIEKLFVVLLKGEYIDVNSLQAVAERILDRSRQREFVPSISCLSVIVQLYERLAAESSQIETQSVLLQILVRSLSALIDGKRQMDVTYLLEYLSEMANFIEVLDDKSIKNAFSEEGCWGEFVKTSLKHALKCHSSGSYLLSLIGDLCSKLYKSNTDLKPSASEVYQLIFGHSNFIPILLGEIASADVKESLLDLMLALISIDANLCQTEHFPILLGAYQPTFTCIDQKILYLMKKYEEHEANMFEFRPFLWGSAAVSHYAVKKSEGIAALWKHPKMENVLSLLDEKKLENTALLFPLDLKLEMHSNVETIASSDIYDPRFLLPLFVHLLEPGCFVNCKKFLESKCLGIIFASLASTDCDMRALGYYSLSQFYQHLEGSLYRERFIWLGLLDSVRNGIQVKNQCLPCLITTFLTRVTKLLLRPQDPLYVPIYHFLTLKPCLDLQNVPEFYKLFYSSHVQHRHHREWILTLMADGLRKNLDFHVCQKRYIFNILLTFYKSSTCTHQYKVLVLHVLKAASRIPNASRVLCQRHGLLAWMRAIIAEENNDEIVDLLIAILHTLWETSCRPTKAEEIDDEDMEKADDIILPGGSANKNAERDDLKSKQKNIFYSSFPVELLFNCFAVLEKISNNPSQKCLARYLRTLYECLSHVESAKRRRSYLVVGYVRHLLEIFRTVRCVMPKGADSIEWIAKILLLWRPKDPGEKFVSAEECECLLPAMEIVCKFHRDSSSVEVSYWLSEWLRDSTLVETLLSNRESSGTIWNSVLNRLTFGKGKKSIVTALIAVTEAVRDRRLDDKTTRKLLRNPNYTNVADRLLEGRQGVRKRDVAIATTFLVELWMKKETPDLSLFLVESETS